MILNPGAEIKVRQIKRCLLCHLTLGVLLHFPNQIQVCVCVPGTELHLYSSARGSQGSSHCPGHLGERHQLQLFLAVGRRKGTSALHTHFKDTYNRCSHSPPPALHSYICFSGTATALCWAGGNFPAEMDLPDVSSGATAL